MASRKKKIACIPTSSALCEVSGPIQRAHGREEGTKPLAVRLSTLLARTCMELRLCALRAGASMLTGAASEIQPDCIRPAGSPLLPAQSERRWGESPPPRKRRCQAPFPRARRCQAPRTVPPGLPPPPRVTTPAEAPCARGHSCDVSGRNATGARLWALTEQVRPVRMRVAMGRGMTATLHLRVVGATNGG